MVLLWFQKRDVEKEMSADNVVKIGICILLIIGNICSTTSILAESDFESDYIVVSAHQNLQEIIDAADSHSTILLKSGMYRSQITINKPLNLVGEDRDSTIFSMKTSPNSAGITLKKSHIFFSNLTIKNNADGLYTTAIRVNALNCTIDNCTIKDTPIGIAVWNDYTKIKYCSFYNCSDEGILLISTSISTSDYNEIFYCYFEKNCDAIELQHSSYNTIKYCTMRQNTHTGIDAICDDNNYNTINYCNIIENTVHGIYFSSSQKNAITNCFFSENGEDDVVFTHESYENTVANNQENLLNLDSEDIYYNISSSSNLSDSSSSFNSDDVFSPDSQDDRPFHRLDELFKFIKNNLVRFHDQFDFL